MFLFLASKEAKPAFMHFKRSDSIFGSSPIKPFFMGRSRLETEFEELEVIGSGGFGEVIKARVASGGFRSGGPLAILFNICLPIIPLDV